MDLACYTTRSRRGPKTCYSPRTPSPPTQSSTIIYQEPILNYSTTDVKPFNWSSATEPTDSDREVHSQVFNIPDEFCPEEEPCLLVETEISSSKDPNYKIERFKRVIKDFKIDPTDGDITVEANETDLIAKKRTGYVDTDINYSLVGNHYGLNLHCLGNKLNCNQVLVILEQFRATTSIYKGQKYFSKSNKTNSRNDNYFRRVDQQTINLCHMSNYTHFMTVLYEETLSLYSHPTEGRSIRLKGRIRSCSENITGLTSAVLTKTSSLDSVLYRNAPSDQDSFVLVNYSETQSQCSNIVRYIGNHPECQLRKLQESPLKDFQDSGLSQNAFFRKTSLCGHSGRVYIDTENFTKIEGEIRGEAMEPGWDVKDSLNTCSIGSKTLFLNEHKLISPMERESCDHSSEYVHCLPETGFHDFMVSEFGITAISLVAFPKDLLFSYFLRYTKKRVINVIFEDHILTYNQVKKYNHNKVYFLNIKDPIAMCRILVSIPQWYLDTPIYYMSNNRFCKFNECSYKGK